MQVYNLMNDSGWIRNETPSFIEFCAQTLGIEEENFEVRVKCSKLIPNGTIAQVRKSNSELFNIEFNAKALRKLMQKQDWETAFAKILAHEMTHIKQYILDGLDLHEDGAEFRGESYRFEHDIEYWLSPWEIEARGMEAGIVMAWNITD